MEYASSFFVALGAGLPYVLRRSRHGSPQLFDDADADDDGEDMEPEPDLSATSEAKRSCFEDHRNSNTRLQLVALLKPQTLGPVLDLCFNAPSDTLALQHACFVVEGILRASPAKLSAAGPRLPLLNYIAFQTGTKAFLLKMWEALTVQTLSPISLRNLRPCQCPCASHYLTALVLALCSGWRSVANSPRGLGAWGYLYRDPNASLCFGSVLRVLHPSTQRTRRR